jgi:predicted PurR-regulated permease PerM
VPNSKAARLVRILEATVLIIATLYFGRPILLPIVAAILITFLLSPPISWLQRRHVPRPVAVLAVVILLFTGLGLIVWTATSQLSELVVQLPTYQETLRNKIKDLRGSESSTLRKVGESIGKLTTEIQKSVDETETAVKQAKDSVESPPIKEAADLPKPTPASGTSASPPTPLPVKVVADPSTPLETANVALSSLAGPLASIGVLTVLVIFMSMVREDLRDRLVRLAGTSQVTLTTRTLDELGTRISRYLLMNALINSGFGLTLGLGLFCIGVQYAALWGLMAAVLRFIPYLGVFIAAAGPIAFTAVQFPAWTQLAMVVGLFVAVELLVDNVVEPLVYGRSAGVAPVALLLAAMFWGWLWGPAGLVLSVPLTVSLAVLGKYLPPLEPLWILLGNESTLPASVSYYQRLLAGDVDEANEIVDAQRKELSLVATFDQVLLPALAQAERDREHGDISQSQQELIWNITEQLVDDLPADVAADPAVAEVAQKPRITVVGVPILDRADELALKMLVRVAPPMIQFEQTATVMLTGELLGRLETNQTDVVCISALGPGGVGQVRYVCKRVRQSFPTLPILVGRWAFHGDADKMAANATQRGASHVVTRLEAALETLAKIPSQRISPVPSAVVA